MQSKFKYLHLLLLLSVNLFATEFHVAKTGNDSNKGSKEQPFLTIQKAATLALAGDTVTVHAGTYREWVNPMHGGQSFEKPIVYRAAKAERVEIKGSEIFKNWKKESNGLWSLVIPHTYFKDYNPYKDSVHGDWFIGKGRIHHTGDVYLNGKSLYELESLEKVIASKPDTSILDKTGSTYTWFCKNNENSTTIYANFKSYDPNKETVELSVRKTCFYPTLPGINFITIQGFEISEAATQWAAPTAEQVGMIATHWNKGWVIENNTIHDTKCNGITLGKERSTGHNVWTADSSNINRDGNIHYIEVVFKTLRNNWNKEHVGSHIVRNNTLYNCEQTGICGSMGAAFSTIENNHIYNIWCKRQFTGFEIAGIKFHGGIDVVIQKNRVDHCGRGIWLDWMAQGAQVSCNLLHDNREDLFLEVNHGPILIDNNILLSTLAIRNWSQSTAFVNNLIAGAINNYADPDRFTPYFLPHSTDIAGLTTIFGGDDRYYNNVFVCLTDTNVNRYVSQTVPDKIFNGKLPVKAENNYWYNLKGGACKTMQTNYTCNYNPKIKLKEDGKLTQLVFTMDAREPLNNDLIVNTNTLGMAKIPKANFETPNGNMLLLNYDYNHNLRSSNSTSFGPFTNVIKGDNTVTVWIKR